MLRELCRVCGRVNGATRVRVAESFVSSEVRAAKAAAKKWLPVNAAVRLRLRLEVVLSKRRRRRRRSRNGTSLPQRLRSRFSCHGWSDPAGTATARFYRARVAVPQHKRGTVVLSRLPWMIHGTAARLRYRAHSRGIGCTVAVRGAVKAVTMNPRIAKKRAEVVDAGRGSGVDSPRSAVRL